jgi:hypothetical protein
MSFDRRPVQAKLDDWLLDGTISGHVGKEMYNSLSKSIAAVFVKMQKEKPDAVKKSIAVFIDTLNGARAVNILPKVDPHDELILLGCQLVWKLGLLQAAPREGPCSNETGQVEYKNILDLSDAALEALVSSPEQNRAAKGKKKRAFVRF